MNGAFNSQIMAEKLAKLNNSQQSIETLSHWCIFHRKKARQVVETWNKKFHELKEQRVAYLYLANDILQNSRRRGGEFVGEFWKVLPAALKEIVEKGDDHGRKVAMRLVDIWEDRKVFGSRGRSLREELLGKDPLPDLPSCDVKTSHHIVKIKVPAGGIQEKLISAYRSLHDVGSDEDATLGRCNAAVIRVEGLEKEADSLQINVEIHDTTLGDELQEQRDILIQCCEQLEMSQLARAALVAHLKEALREQESKLELIRTQLQISQDRAEHALKLRSRLLNCNSNMGEIIQQGPNEIGSDSVVMRQGNEGRLGGVAGEASKTKVATSSAAAEVAAKLAASTSSAQMLASVLSSLAAEEAAAAAVTIGTITAPSSEGTAPPPLLPLSDKRQRVDTFPSSSLPPSDRTIDLETNPLPFAHPARPPAPPPPNTTHYHHHISSALFQPPLPPFPPQQSLYISNPTQQISRGISSLPPLVAMPQQIVMNANLNTASYPQQQPSSQPPGVNIMYAQPPLPAPPPPRP